MTTAVGWLINNKGMVGTTLSISDNKPCGRGGSNGDDISNDWAQGDGGGNGQ